MEITGGVPLRLIGAFVMFHVFSARLKSCPSRSVCFFRARNSFLARLKARLSKQFPGQATEKAGFSTSRASARFARNDKFKLRYSEDEQFNISEGKKAAPLLGPRFQKRQRWKVSGKAMQGNNPNGLAQREKSGKTSEGHFVGGLFH
jgi:hypothetical protein